MLKSKGFYRGVNLGGWLSQCDYGQERLDNFITETDIATIASWGLDHVRLPIDYNVLENDNGSYKEDGFSRIDKAIAWYKDINSIFEKYNISRSAWSYKQMDFGLSDERLDEIREELLKFL